MVEALYLNAVLALGGRSDSRSRTAYEALEAAYLGESRHYHNLRHIERCLETFLWLEEGLTPMVSACVVLALAYHDAVYDPRSTGNEAASAAMARRELAKLDLGASDEIERLILLTRDHRVPEGDVAGALVVDSDLAILQTTVTEYDAYAAAIRREYDFVLDDEYRIGRRKVLEGLMARRLFVSPLLDEDAARANMRREIERLSG